MTTDTPARAEPGRIELCIDGMTCEPCARRVEHLLNELDGVSASVDAGTGTAAVRCAPDLDPADLVARVQAAGYTARWPASGAAEPTDSPPTSGRRLFLSALLAVPVITLTSVPEWQFRHWPWIALALAAAVALGGAGPFHRAAARSARGGRATTDTLVSLGALTALGWSGYALLLGVAGGTGIGPPAGATVGPASGITAIHLDIAAGLPVLVLAVRHLETRSRRRAGAVLRGLTGRVATDVTVLRDATEARVPTEHPAIGTSFLVGPGEIIAADGVVLEGTSAVDASALGGPANPVEVRPGDPVAGGGVNAGGRLAVRATHVGPDPRLSRITRRVAAAQHGRVEVQRRADRRSGVLVPIVIGLAVGTLGYWLGAGASPAHAVTTAVAVLIAGCPCALGLVTSTALIAGVGRGAQLGILFTGPEVLESARSVDTVLLDRTGTLTTGVMTVHRVHPAESVPAEQALRLAGAVEQASAHPIGRAIAGAAAAAAPAVALSGASDEDRLPGVAEFDSTPGMGVRGLVAELVDGTVIAHAVLVGRPALLSEHGIELPAELVTARAATEAAGHTAVAVAWDGVARAVLAIGDTVRPTSAQAVRRLRALGLDPILLTGDDGAAARVVADQVGLPAGSVRAEVRPEDKADVVRRLQAEGRVVALVGGVDDAAALAVADLGVTTGPGPGAHVEAGDLTVPGGDPLAVLDAIRLARRTLAVIRGIPFLAFACTLAAAPVAATGLLSPLIVAAATAACAVAAATGIRRVRRFAPTRSRDGSVT